MSFLTTPAKGYTIKGQNFWIKETMKNKICPLFYCAVHQNSFKNCNECQQLPSKKLTELKNLNISTEEHLTELQKKRISILIL